MALESIKHQTEENCLAAVKKNGLELKYVKEQSKKICLAAINENPEAIQFVKYRSDVYDWSSIHEGIRQCACPKETALLMFENIYSKSIEVILYESEAIVNALSESKK